MNLLSNCFDILVPFKKILNLKPFRRKNAKKEFYINFFLRIVNLKKVFHFKFLKN